MRLRFFCALSLVAGGVLIGVALVGAPVLAVSGFLDQSELPGHGWDQQIRDNTRSLEDRGRETFRYNTFGSEQFFGETLRLDRAIEGSKLGGVGGGVSPKTALAVGLKVDMDALPSAVVDAIKAGQVNLDDPAVTLTLLQLGAVVGVEGIFNNPNNPTQGLKSVGVTCALCHSTVDDAFAPGIGHRLDGWANQDLNVGAIIALSPNLDALTAFLNAGLPADSHLTTETVNSVLMSWGPGKFDAELNLDGKAVNPHQMTDGVETGTNVPGATLIPNAFGLAGHNLHTWGGGWGTVTYWNAFVANLEMSGVGRFFDPRLANAEKYPIAAAHQDGNKFPAGDDRITQWLGPLQFYQLSLPTPKAPAGSFDAQAAARGQAVFNGRGQCAGCHVPPLFTEPGWNAHKAADIGIDDFQASRSPDDSYRTAALAGRLFNRKHGFYHDGRFATLMDVVNHYDTHLKLDLNDRQKADLVEYLKSI